MTLSRVIEALLFSAQKPLSVRELTEAIRGSGAEDEFSPNEFARVREAEVAAALEQLKIENIEQQRAFQLNERAEGWQLASDPKYAQWVRTALSGTKTGASECACARDPRDHCLSPADHPRGCRSSSRRKHRRRAANINGARAR